MLDSVPLSVLLRVGIFAKSLNHEGPDLRTGSVPSNLSRGREPSYSSMFTSCPSDSLEADKPAGTLMWDSQTFGAMREDFSIFTKDSDFVLFSSNTNRTKTRSQDVVITLLESSAVQRLIKT